MKIDLSITVSPEELLLLLDGTTKPSSAPPVVSSNFDSWLGRTAVVKSSITDSEMDFHANYGFKLQRHHGYLVIEDTEMHIKITDGYWFPKVMFRISDKEKA